MNSDNTGPENGGDLISNTSSRTCANASANFGYNNQESGIAVMTRVNKGNKILYICNPILEGKTIIRFALLLSVVYSGIACTTYLVRVAPDCNRSYCEDSFSGYSGSV